MRKKNASEKNVLKSLPNKSIIFVPMQDALPKLGREKMEQFNEDCKSLKDMIDFELKTSEDYVDNMNIKEKLQARFAQLQSKLEAIGKPIFYFKISPIDGIHLNVSGSFTHPDSNGVPFKRH